MITTTNKFNIPQFMYDALLKDDYVKRGDISTTELIKPPQVRVLSQRYVDKIVQDITDLTKMKIGTAFHKYMEDHTEGVMCEVPVHGTFKGWNLTGTIDVVTENTIYDYKVSSTWSVIFGAKDDWMSQLNIYKLLLDDPNITFLKDIVVCTDHSKSKAKIEIKKNGSTNYPVSNIVPMNIPVWDAKSTKKYIEDRIVLHQKAEKLDDTELPECSPAERWERRGKSIRCEDYCSVEPFCQQRIRQKTQKEKKYGF